MGDLVRLEHALDQRLSAGGVIAVVDRPPLARTPGEETQAIHSNLSSLLPPAANFALHLAAVASTHAQGGPPPALLVLGDVPPADPVIRVRLIGVLVADHTEHGRTWRRDHAVAVAETSDTFSGVMELADLGEPRLEALSQAWSAYNNLRAANFQVVAIADAAAAARLVVASGGE